MKTIKIMKRLMGCAAAILALTACSESEDLLAAYHSDSKAVHITAQVGKASADGFTRSNPLGDAKEQAKFNENDEISVKADGQDAVTYQFNGSEWLPKESSKFLKWEKETMNFTAYYPATYTGGDIEQPEKYNEEADLAAADYMSFTDKITNPGDNSLKLAMNRLMARVVVEIAGFNDQYAGATVNNVSSVSICGVKAYKHTDNKFYALIKPCAAQSSETFLSLEVAEGESKTTTTEKYTGIPELVAGNSYTYKLTVGKNKISVSGITVADWNTGTITDNGKAEQIIRYVTFKAEAEQKFKMTTNGDYRISGLQYSVKNGKWQDVVAGTEVTFGGANGDLRLRGTNPNGTANGSGAYSTITFTKDALVACTGDIRTLLDWNNYNKVETHYANFCYLFMGCSKLTSAPELPAETLAINCYQNMFVGCTKLSTVTMLAPSDKITSIFAYMDWLYDAGTDASSRTLKVLDADAYTALEGTGYLPDIWKKGAANTTVLNKDDGEIK